MKRDKRYRNTRGIRSGSTRLLAVLLAAILLAACADTKASPEAASRRAFTLEPTEIVIVKPLRFAGAEGGEVIAASGIYSVAAHSDRSLSLKRTGTQDVLIVRAAEGGRLKDRLERDVAFITRANDSSPHIVLWASRDGRNRTCAGFEKDARSRGDLGDPVPFPIPLQLLLGMTFDVVSPAAGDVWQAGTTHPITWSRTRLDDTRVAPPTATFALYKVKSEDPVLPITSGYPASLLGPYQWTIPATLAPGKYYIYINWAGKSGFSAQFTIAPAAVTPLVAAGNIASYAIVGGNVYAWGRYSYEWALAGTSPTPIESVVPVLVYNGGDAKALSPTGSAFVRHDGTVVKIRYGNAYEVAGLTDVSGLYGYLALTNGGAVLISDGADNPIGGGIPNGYVPVPGLTGIVAIAHGAAIATLYGQTWGHGLALSGDGRVFAWGENRSGQLGDGTNVSKVDPIEVPGLTDIIAVAANTAQSFALSRDGNVYAWGSSYTPSPAIIMTGVATLVSGGASSNHPGAVLAIKNGGGVRRLGGTTAMIETVAGAIGATAIAGGTAHTLFVRDNGVLKALGNNSAGQLGNGSTTDSDSPVIVQFP